VTYDPVVSEPVCTAAISDAAGLAFDIPGENLRLQISRDGFTGTTKRWIDHWKKVD
jgi:hypothetical protein